MRHQPLLSIGTNPKVLKGNAFGYWTAILHLSPADQVLQLGQDVYTYGVWEALLYVESYERTAPENGGPAYLPGTAVAALKAWRAGRAKAKKIVGTE